MQVKQKCRLPSSSLKGWMKDAGEGQQKSTLAREGEGPVVLEEAPQIQRPSFARVLTMFTMFTERARTYGRPWSP